MKKLFYLFFLILQSAFAQIVQDCSAPYDNATALVSVLVNGVQVERIIPRLRDRSERQAKALMAQKARQKKSAWWWPGHSIRPAEYERVRRAEKEIFNEKRRIGLKPKGVPR